MKSNYLLLLIVCFNCLLENNEKIYIYPKPIIYVLDCDIMYCIGKSYKLRILLPNEKKPIVYTGRITEETDNHISLYTIRREKRILNKNNIIDCIELNGDDDGIGTI